MAKALTQLAIDNHKPGPTRRELPDGKERGLYLVSQPTGAKAWALRYRFQGQPRKLTIGSYPEIGIAKARVCAAKAKVLLADGIDPGTAKETAKAVKKAEKIASDLVEKVVADFIELHAKPNTRDWKETQRLLKQFADAWKGRRLPEIGKSDIHGVLDKIVARGAPVGANRAFAQLRKMCRWAVSRGIIERSACDGIERPSNEKNRDRTLDTDELRLVWRSAQNLGFPFGPIVKLLVLTGQRRSEVGGIEWRELDLERGLWRLPAERSKNRRGHSLPLSPQALEILRALPRFAGSRFVFSPGKTPPSGFSRAKTRLDKFIANLNNGDPIAPWILHDIRRSVASGLASLGVSLPTIEKLLNHVSGSFGGVAGVYQQYNFADEMRAATEAWGQFVHQLISDQPIGDVDTLQDAKALK